jgi:hypothetical protein
LGGITLATQPGDAFVAGELVRLAIISTSGAQLCQLSQSASAGTSMSVSRATIDAACGAAGTAFTAVGRIAVSISREA